MVRRAILLLCAVLLVPVVVRAADGQASIESELLGLINGDRGSDLIMHSGLRIVGRVHSQEMSRDGGLNHGGAEGRIREAPPDPSEANGPPDDGFTGTWCENVAYVRGAPEHEVAQRMYQGWTNSPPHDRCMNDERMTAAGVGVFFDGETYWATLESAVDRTLPGSAPPPTPTPTPSPEITPSLRTEPPERTAPPEPTAAPTPTERPEPTDRTAPPLLQVSPSASPAEQVMGTAGAISSVHGRNVGTTEGFVASPALPTAERNPITWVGLVGVLAALGLVGETLRRLSRPKQESEPS